MIVSFYVPTVLPLLITISNEAQPLLRFLAAADAVATAEQVATTLHEQANAYCKLSSSIFCIVTIKGLLIESCFGSFFIYS